MSKITRVPFGTRNENGRDAVFVAIIVRESQPYLNTIGAKDPNAIVSLILNIDRTKGDIGLVGGNVDGNETLIETIVRETEEEINFTLDEEKLIPVCSHSFAINTHLFAYYVSEIEMKKIEVNALYAKHRGSEVSGTNIVHIVELPRRKGIEKYLKNSFASSVLEELLILLKEQNILSEERVEYLRQSTGIEIPAEALEIKIKK